MGQADETENVLGAFYVEGIIVSYLHFTRWFLGIGFLILWRILS
jgi:hypothetical protein